jgi:copper/silver efflux system protein
VIERLIQASARNKFLVFIFAIFGVAAGIYGLIHTPLDAIPDLSDVQVIVYTDWEWRRVACGSIRKCRRRRQRWRK